MKPKITSLIAGISFAVVSLAVPMNLSAWSQKGHDVTAFIAENHLTPATAAAVDSIFEGMSLVYWANWLDNASHNPPYEYTRTWHYRNVDANQTYETAPINPEGDAVTALYYCQKQLGDSAVSLPDKQLALKMLVHIMGDLHQPMHLGHASDAGGNKVKVQYFFRDTNLHSVWDGQLVESAHKWSYTEWQQQIDRLSPADERSVLQGNYDDWAKESVKLADRIYKTYPPKSYFSYNDVAKWTPVIETQLLKAGLRLAHILNLTFDPEYSL